MVSKGTICHLKAFVGLDYCHDNIDTFASKFKLSEGSRADFSFHINLEDKPLHYTIFMFDPTHDVLGLLAELKRLETLRLVWVSALMRLLKLVTVIRSYLRLNRLLQSQLLYVSTTFITVFFML